jgi:hypothetical protein
LSDLTDLGRICQKSDKSVLSKKELRSPDLSDLTDLTDLGRICQNLVGRRPGRPHDDAGGVKSSHDGGRERLAGPRRRVYLGYISSPAEDDDEEVRDCQIPESSQCPKSGLGGPNPKYAHMQHMHICSLGCPKSGLGGPNPKYAHVQHMHICSLRSERTWNGLISTSREPVSTSREPISTSRCPKSGLGGQNPKYAHMQPMQHMHICNLRSERTWNGLISTSRGSSGLIFKPSDC